MLENIDQWLESYISEFDPFLWEVKQEAELRRKATGELAIYLHVLRSFNFQISGILCEHLIAQIQDTRYVELIRRNISRLALFGSALIFITRHGHSSECEKLIQDISSSTSQLNRILSIERVPYRTLEIWHLFQSITPDKNPVGFRAVECGGCLQYPLDIFSSSTDDAYALTHTIFYATDFGSGSKFFHSLTLPDGSGTSLNALVLRFFAERNFDIMIELAIAGVICDIIRAETLALVKECLQAQLKSDGVIFVDPATMSDVYEQVPKESKFWAKHYHTMMVAGLLFALIKRKEQTAKLDEVNQETLAELMLLGEGIRALSQYDLSRGARILTTLLPRHVSRVFADIFDGAREFIKTQQRDSENYGYFVDEARLLDKQHGHEYGAAILAKSQIQVNEACSAFLDKSKGIS